MSFWNKNLTTRKESTPNAVSWQNEMSNFLDRINREYYGQLPSQKDFQPKLELKETEKNYQVMAELPGMKEEDLHVTVQDNTLILEGEKKNETKKEEKGYYASEFTYGCFYRAIPFSVEINPEKVIATYKNGILTVTIDKNETNSMGARKIAVRQS